MTFGNEMKTTLTILILLAHLILLSNNRETDSLTNILPQTEGEERLDILQTLTKYYMFTSLDSCLKYGNIAREYARETENLINEADACKKMGYANYLKGNYDQSLEYYNDAYDLYIKAHEYLDASVINNFLGNTYTQLGQYNVAIEYLLKTEKSCDTLILIDSLATTVKKLYAIVNTNIGLVYHQLDSLDKSLECFERALEYAQQINDSIRITASYSNIGMIYKARKDYDRAFDHYFDALEISRRIENKNYESAILNNLATINSQYGNNDSAMYFFEKAREIMIEMGDKYGHSLVNHNIANVLIDENETDLAIQYLDESQKISLEINSLSQTYSNYGSYAEAYTRKGDYKTALDYYKQYTTLKDSVTGNDVHEQIAELEIKYETEKKEKENLDLRTKNEINQLRISQKNTAIITLIIGIFFIILSFLIMFLLYRGRYLAFRNLVKKNIHILNMENDLESTRQLLEGMRKNNGAQGRKSEPEDQLKNISQRLDSYMKTDKPHFVSNITIEELSTRLETNRTYLSNAIKQEYGHSFSAYINEYRIKEAMRLLLSEEYDHYSIEGIGQQVGFSNRISFNTNFKKFTGVSPSLFRDRR